MKIRYYVFRALIINSVLFDCSKKNEVYSKEHPSHYWKTIPLSMCTIDYVKKYGSPLGSAWTIGVESFATNSTDFLSVERFSNEVFDHGYDGSEEFIKHGPNDDFGFPDFYEKPTIRLFYGTEQKVGIGGNSSWHDVARYKSQTTTIAQPKSEERKIIKKKPKPKIYKKNEIEPPYYTANDTFSRFFGKNWNYDGTNSSKTENFLRWLPNSCDNMRRIVGGWRVKSIEQLPYMAFLDSGCGGAIIGRRWVITAGRCIGSGTPSYVYVGSLELLGGCQYTVAKTHLHPKFSLNMLSFDIALLKIEPKFTYSPAIKPIRMANTHARVGTCGIVAGWGSQRFGGILSGLLKMAILPVVLKNRCRIYDLRLGQFCAGFVDGSADTCQGDSGGPFVIDGRLVGITSIGHKCGRPRSPGIYINVWLYRNWIRRTTRIP